MGRKERVTKIIDGDTFMTKSRKHPVRLWGVNTPEKGQPGYERAKRALQRLIKDKEVIVDTKARDIYGRAVAIVKVNNKSVNKVMKKFEN
jgi:endonuclease YncB( thermonuclease family)